MPLTQMEIDLREYAVKKIGDAMSDVAQAFEIAYGYKAHSLPCLGAVLLRMAAMVAATGAGKEMFVQSAANVFDEELARQKRHDAKHERNKRNV